MISKIQYISQGKNPAEHLANIQLYCEAGGDWVQLRLKDYDYETLIETGFQAKVICKKFDAKLIINDFIDVADTIKAHGVHLGKKDDTIDQARKALGKQAIIGGTANTLEDCVALINQNIDYIGLGPFRFTSTKKNLSPILGYEGYQQIMGKLKAYETPVLAIGGIQIEDIASLMTLGIYGVAGSGFLTQPKDLSAQLKKIKAFL